MVLRGSTAQILKLIIAGIAYVQGMNEILGPIYYTFVTDAGPGQEEWAEADSFFCFTGKIITFILIFLFLLFFNIFWPALESHENSFLGQRVYNIILYQG